MVVGIIIGSGIFLVPHEIIAAVGSAHIVYLVWVVGGLLSLFGAMSYAEIAAARPRYGGEYTFLREAYGDLTAFLYMWTNTIISKPASLGSIAAGLTRTLATFSIFAFFNNIAFAQLYLTPFLNCQKRDGGSQAIVACGACAGRRRSAPRDAEAGGRGR